MVTMRHTTLTNLGSIATACLVVSTLMGCSSSGDGDDLVIVADDSGWTASGGSVDAGVMCPGGTQQGLGFLELDGSPLAPGEGFERVVEAIWTDPPDVVADLLRLTEYTCADGSGSFTTVEEPRNEGPWSVREGSSTYAEMSGSGTLQIEREHLDGPDQPPGGMPRSTTLTGVIEIAD